MDTNQAQTEQEQTTQQMRDSADFAKKVVDDAKAYDNLKLEDIIPEGRTARDTILLQMESFKYKQRLAGLFAASGLFGLKGSPDQAIAKAFSKIELGESMGFSAAESMSGIDIIGETVAIRAQLRAARMQKVGFTWDIDWFADDKGVCIGCRMWLYRNGKPMMAPHRDAAGNIRVDDTGKPMLFQVSESFMREDAERMKTKIWEGPQGHRTSRDASILEKDNWIQTPRNMYWSRCATNMQRFHAPGVLNGDIPSVEEVWDRPDYGQTQQSQPAETGSTVAQQEVRNKKLAELGGEPVLTDVEQESLFKVVKEAGVSQSDAAQVIKAHGFQSFADITRGKLVEIIESIRAAKAAVAAQEEKKERPSKPTFGGPKS